MADHDIFSIIENLSKEDLSQLKNDTLKSYSLEDSNPVEEQRKNSVINYFHNS